jgi:hypothetical protein
MPYTMTARERVVWSLLPRLANKVVSDAMGREV